MIDPEGIAYLLQGRATLIPLPEDVSIVRYNVRWETNAAVLILESASYDEVPDGHTLPIENLQMRTMPPVNFNDLADIYSKLVTRDRSQPMPKCDHFDAITRDRYGVYFLACKQCGAFAMSDEHGARRLGWIL